MSPSRKEEIIRQFVDLEEYGEELFALAATAPPLSRKSKKVMVRSIIGKKRWNIPQITLFSTATAFAAFAFLFGFAQLTNAPHFLASLRIAKPTAQVAPSPQQVQQVQQQLLQQQTKIDELQKTGAPAAEIAKAVDDLNSSVKKTENKGYLVTKTTDKNGKTYIYVKAPSSWQDDNKSGSSSGNDANSSKSSNESSGFSPDDH